MPKYPVFIPTKNRFDSRQTVRMFTMAKVPFTVVIEEHEFDNYRTILPEDRILVLPFKNKGLMATRNWIWDYAHSKGYKRFWTFDDNIKYINRTNNNQKHTRVVDAGTALKVIEDFTERYKNVVIAGMNYVYFVVQTAGGPPYYLNTRVYSNMLIETDARDKNGNFFRNKLFFNDDTDLCLQVLKDGKCTILFNAFTIDKKPTMIMKGGMREYYDDTNNRYEFVRELAEAHPDVVKITKKFGRYHHHVNYRPFLKANKLQRVDNYDEIVKPGVDNYGLELKYIGNEKEAKKL